MGVDLSNKGIQSEINITPLVDVVLVLLIIFMVATPVLHMGLDVEIPPKVTDTAEQRDPDREQIVVRASASGFTVNGSAADQATLVSAIERALQALPEGEERVVFVDADAEVEFGRTVTAMDAARSAGATRVGVLAGGSQRQGMTS